MKFKKTPVELIEIVDRAVQGYVCERKRMFGAMAYFVNGNMFAGAHQDVLFLRLHAAGQKNLMKEFDEVSSFEPMPGRKMAEYVAVPESVFESAGMLEQWVPAAYGYAKGLPKKVKKKRTNK